MLLHTMLQCNNLNTSLINVDGLAAGCKLGQRQIATPYGNDILQTCLSQLEMQLEKQHLSDKAR